MKTIGAATLLLLTAQLVAAEPITLDNVDSPAEISADEPFAPSFSLEQAAQALDTAALDWQKTRACTACHTMMPYLMARPALSFVSPQSAEVRQFFEEVVRGQREAMPGYSCKDLGGAVEIGVASALAMNDRQTTGRLHPLTRQALDRMWTLQRRDGGWDWPFRDTPPLKINEHYGVTLAAIAAGSAPDDYARTPAARAGLEGVRHYLSGTRPADLHQSAMLLWASCLVEKLLSSDEKSEIASRLMASQRPDDGWSLASLVDNSRNPGLKEPDRAAALKAEAGFGTEFLVYVGRDGVYKTSLASDGYATGFVIFVMRLAGVPADHPQLRKGIEWLKTHQRASGRWFTPSQSMHTQHLISNAGTAYCVLALSACGEIPAGRPKE